MQTLAEGGFLLTNKERVARIATNCPTDIQNMKRITFRVLPSFREEESTARVPSTDEEKGFSANFDGARKIIVEVQLMIESVLDIFEESILERCIGDAVESNSFKFPKSPN